MGFELREGPGAEPRFVNHAVWCDNIVLFASDPIMLQTMLHELTARMQSYGLSWKPTSLEILPGATYAEGIDAEFQVFQKGCMDTLQDHA